MEEKLEAKIVMHNGQRVNWNKSFSSYGYRLSEVISAVVKEMRRGKEEESVFWAYQMMISGKKAEEFLWQRFRIFTIEDIGLANPQSLIYVASAKDLYYSIAEKEFDRYSVGACTAVYLSRNPKTRYTHEMLQDVEDMLHEGSLNPEIPDYAMDIHLPHARAMGRDMLHYLTEASVLANEDISFSRKYKDRLIERAR